MTPSERREHIVTLVRQRGRITVDELAEILGISHETVRRDLTRLADAGKVRKFHGGASLPLAGGEGPFSERMRRNALEKTRIARAAAALVAPGETLFVDTGSTTLYLAEELARIEGLTVITNSCEIARIVAASGRRSRSFLLGGAFSSENRQTTGAMAMEHVRLFRAHHCMLTIGALDARTGAMDYDHAEAQMARAMIEQSASLTILVDASKFGNIASFEVCPLARIDHLVCDRPPDPPLAEAIAEAGVRLHVAAGA